MKNVSTVKAAPTSRVAGVATIAMLLMGSLLFMSGVLLACGQIHAMLMNG